MLNFRIGGRQLQVGFATDKGTRRAPGQPNEDSFAVIGDDDQFLLVSVADGVGGDPGGNVASAIATSVLRHEVRRLMKEHRKPRCERWGEWVYEELVPAIRQHMADEARMNPVLSGMSTTLVFLLFIEETAFLFKIGDSRFYLKSRNGDFFSMLDDHTLFDDPLCREDPRFDNSRAQRGSTHVLSRFLSPTRRHYPDNYAGELAGIYRGFIATDGIYGKLDDDAMEGILYSSDDPDQIACNLVRAARAAGASDDATVVVVI